MSIEYSQAGFSFSTSAAELAGVAHKIVTFKKYAVNQSVIDEIDSLKSKLVVLDNAIKKAQNAAYAQALSSLLIQIKKSYSYIVSGVKAFVESSDAKAKNAATALAKKTSKLGDIFTGKANVQLGNVESLIALYKKNDGEEDLKTLKIHDHFAKMEELVNSYKSNYSEKVTEEIDNKGVEMTKAAAPVREKIQNLRKLLTALQTVGPNEDKLVSYLNNMWKEAKIAQTLSANSKKKGKK